LIRGLSCAYDFEGCRFHRQRVRRAERDEFLWPLPAVASIGDLSLEEQADILVFLQTHDPECAGNDTREEILAELRAAPSARGAAPVAPSPRRAGLAAAARALRFIGNLTHVKGADAGKPFNLRDWQKRPLVKIFGTPKAETPND
jgi:hypothetical protein